MVLLRYCIGECRRYWDVEMRVVPAEEGRYSSTPELMEPYIDENTVGGWAGLLISGY